MPTAHQWTFKDLAGDVATVGIKPRIVCNSAEMETAMALAGLGVTRLPEFTCAEELKQGRLEPALANYEGPPLGIHVIYPHRRHVSAKVRAFIDFLSDRSMG